MEQASPEVIRLRTEEGKAEYDNHALTAVNDHEIRISTMTEAYHWHFHPDSDEAFLVLDGGLLIDFEDRTVQLFPGEMITVPRGVRHRTRPMGKRSVNLTFERRGTKSEVATPPAQD